MPPIPDERALLDDLRSPRAYPHPVHEVELRSTHISRVLLAGDHVYKIKRPVDLGFLDFTSLEARRHFCQEEVRLNRRLAPDTYLGVVPVVRGTDGAARLGRSEDPSELHAIEWAVHMRRLPDEGMLPNLLESGVSNDLLDELAALLARFHAACPSGPEVRRYGAVDSLRARIDRHRREMHDVVDDGGVPVLPRRMVDHLAEWSARELDRHAALFESRVAEGRIREGHGDLHCGNICRDGADWIVFDCIEFRQDFRSLDVAAELAFLAMDCAARGARAEGRYVAHRYAELADDPELGRLLPFYEALYASVRAKVQAIGAADEQDEAARAAGTEEALRTLALAVGFTLPPMVVLTCGLPGSGKSVAARSIAGVVDAAIVRSDVVRKRLAGLAPTDRRGRDPDSTLYSPAMHEATLDAVEEEARAWLTRGRSVVVDATNGTRHWRERFDRLAADHGVPAYLLWLDPPPEVLRERLERRAVDPHEASDATLDVLEPARRRFERPDEWPWRRLALAGHRTGVGSLPLGLLETVVDARER